MKKIMCILLLIAFLVSCKSTEDSEKPLVVTIKGVAAIGVVLPKGSEVQVRGSAVDGVASEVKTSAISDDQGNYAIDVSGLTGPYLLRVNDPAGHSDGHGHTYYWYYSLAQESGSTANINPLTDSMVRAWYQYSSITNLALINIDNSFSSGVYPSGVSYCHYNVSLGALVPENTALPMPSAEDINYVTTSINFWLANGYIASGSTVELTNPVTSPWIVGQGYDQILDF